VAKRKKYVKKAESQILCDVHENSGGDWDKVMRDSRIKKMKFSREHLVAHLQNKQSYARRHVKKTITLAGSACESDEEELRSEEEDNYGASSSSSPEEPQPENPCRPEGDNMTQCLALIRERVRLHESATVKKNATTADMELTEMRARYDLLQWKVNELQASLNETLALVKLLLEKQQ
jgi:hypothetical protein